ncbi:hypothetical protein Mgra_00009354 [Meloidogyne graminicola]|uniref:Uncharacterized protein n=1 Tax=Meloidogyne graminicola TaxID=189291 RepID=A0A8S9Z817_9BILA|nr:hypothetical protein Mgra_00009354 [Meloidogyne graminicola]
MACECACCVQNMVAKIVNVLTVTAPKIVDQLVDLTRNHVVPNKLDVSRLYIRKAKLIAKQIFWGKNIFDL